jgi:uncharacterized membrane protein
MRCWSAIFPTFIGLNSLLSAGMIVPWMALVVGCSVLMGVTVIDPILAVLIFEISRRCVVGSEINLKTSFDGKRIRERKLLEDG